VKITLLGTGTSQGVPVIGCQCDVCVSDNPHDNRLRSSVLLSHGDWNILIDAGPDFRQQMLRANVRHLDAIFLTHEHNDHVIGMDDIRPFNHRSGKSMSVYALPRVAQDVRRRFEYVFKDPLPGLPRIDLIPIELGVNHVFGDLIIQPIGVMHGKLPIVGFRMGEMAYLTDVKTVEAEEIAKLFGIKFLIVNALHHEPHPTHMNLSEALAFEAALGPQQTWFTHISHHMGLANVVGPLLPPHVSLAFDGQQIEFQHQ
jgi:phosphoribosyl 1,2-cyclic phosphate phosphodiesterase